MTEFWAWADHHWFLAFILVFLALDKVPNMFVRFYRMIMVLARGWPTAPHMDADGDIVHPPKGGLK